MSTDNPNWENEEIDPNWTRPATPNRPKLELSDYSKHVQECFKKRHCPHQRFYSFEDECLTCRTLFDQNGKRIPEPEPNHSSPPPYNSSPEHDEEYIVVSRSPSPQDTIESTNAEADALIKKITKTDSLVDMVLPDIPYSKTDSLKYSIWRRNALKKASILADCAFPANYGLTYVEACKRFQQFLGHCHHNVVFNSTHPQCDDCIEYYEDLRNRHSVDYNRAIGPDN
jgi:hypothetical protein